MYLVSVTLRFLYLQLTSYTLFGKFAKVISKYILLFVSYRFLLIKLFVRYFSTEKIFFIKNIINIIKRKL